MLKKQNLKKSKRWQQVKGCLVCKIARIPFLVTISSVILLQKYYRPLQKSMYVSVIHPLIRQASHKISIKYREVQLQSSRQEILNQYHNFSSIIGKIKPVVLERIKRDKLIAIHYNGKSHKIMLIHSLLKRNIKVNRYRPAKQEKTQSTDEDHYQKNIKKQIKGQKMRSNQTASMRRLTRSLSSMVQRFQQQYDFHSSFIIQLMNLAQKHTIGNISQNDQTIFRKFLENNNISEIKSKHEIERLITNPQPLSYKFQENYGFQIKTKNLPQQYKSNQNDKKRLISPNALKVLKQNYPQRIQTDYDCQKIKSSKKKSSISSSKRQNDKMIKNMGSMSKKKQLKVSTTKSRVKCG